MRVRRLVLVVNSLALVACGATSSSTTGTTTATSTSGTHGASTTGSTITTSNGATSTSSAGTTGTSTTGTSTTTSTSAASTTTGTSATSTTTASSTTATSTTTSSTSGTTTGGDCCAQCYENGDSCDSSACTCGGAACQTGALGSMGTDAIDLASVTVMDSSDVSAWSVTTSITSMQIDSTGFNPTFDKRTQWPSFTDSAGTTVFTLWIFENIGGQWYGAAGIRFSPTDVAGGGAPSAMGVNWFYDASRWGPLANRQPAEGEIVGFMVSAGDSRGAAGTNAQERSNIVLMPFPPDSGGSFSCSAVTGTSTTGTTGTSTTGTSGTTTTGTSGSGVDCCNGACDGSTTWCDPTTCACAAQGSYNLAQASVYDSPPDIANWPVTTSITSLSISGSGGFAVTFDKEGTSCDYQNGAQACDGSNNPPVDENRWPDVCIPGWNGGSLQYTLWSVEYINGAWATSGPIEYWCGLPSSGGSPSGFAADWYYDSRWGPLANYQPAVGEWVGFFVSAGNARNITSDDPSQSTVMERSNVVFVPFPADTGASWNF